MLKLKIQKKPYWLDLGYGVKVKVRPCTSAIFYEAKAYMNSKIAELANLHKANKAVGQTDTNLPDIENQVKREAFADGQLLIGLAIAGIVEWEGVLEADSNEPALLNEDKLAELFSNFWVVAENFRGQYCGIQEMLEAEKNASTSEPNGTLEAGETIAKAAEKTKSSAQLKSANIIKQP